MTALLAGPVAEEAGVTRAQGFSVDILEQTTDAAMVAATPEVSPQAPVTQASSGQISADFFSAAQANLDRDTRCVAELNALSAQAKVYFPSGGLTGEQTGISQARVLGLLAKQCPGVVIEVSGHSDPSGDPVINRRLSLERAEAVITRVGASGIDTSLFVAVGRGSDVPSNTTGPQDDAYYDRRVEFAVLETAVQDPTIASVGTGLTQAVASACVIELEAAVAGASIEYAPNGMTFSDEDLARASALATLATNCPQARLRLIGQHDDNVISGEDAATGRLRAIVLHTTLVSAGFPSDQLIMGSPSDSRPINGFSNSRVDFDFIVD